MMQKLKIRFSKSVLLFSLLLSMLGNAKAQDSSFAINGKVVDLNGEALMGVTIKLKGTTTGTITDYNGFFKIMAEVKNPTLLFSYMGYQTLEIIPDKFSNLKITMTEDSRKLDELVVVGYGTQRKKDLTGSVSVIKTDEINSIPVPSISDAMQGRAAGVQVITTGAPGADATFRIRGTGTINNSNPLIVIDGVPMTGGLNQLNMDDVESLQVLKDASATAIYGSRGANGVVIITTKKGQNLSEGDSKINFKYSYGVQQATHMIDMLNAEQFASLHNEMLVNGGQTPNPAFADPASLGTGTNWLDALFQKAPMENYSLSYSGNTGKTNYYVSGNYLNQKGIVKSTGFERFTFQINTDSKINNWLKFGNNLTLNHDVKPSGSYSIQSAMLSLPTQPIYHEDGTFTGPVGIPLYAGDILNPIATANTVKNNTSGYNLMGSVYAEIELLKNLKFKTSYGLQANFWDSRTWSPKYAWDSKVESNSYLFQQYNKSITWLFDNILSYDFVKGNHRLGMMTGTSAQENTFSYINASVKNFPSEQTQELANGTDQKTMGGSGNSWSLFSIMGRINYSYADKYMITTTLRRDGSSRFGSGNKFGWFPSASVAWRVSEEDFLKDAEILNNLKLRAGYGVTGNQEIGNYSFASSLNTYVYNFNNQVVSAIIPTVMPNPFVQWEQQKQGNVGVDATILDQRIDISLEAYLKATDKMLVPMVVPVSTGYSDIYVPSINAGNMENKGLELTVSTRNLTGNLKWNTDFNVSYNQNKVVSINDTIPMATGSIGLNANLALLKAGLPVNEFYGFVTDGIFQTPEEVYNHASQVPGNNPATSTAPGDIRFKDLNNDGVINDLDRAYLGSPSPTFIFAMNNSFSCKGFDLSIFFQGVAGNKIINANRFWSEAMSVSQNQTVQTLNRWTGEGTSNSMPRAVFNDPNKNTRPSDRYVEDGSYVRLKNLTLGYTMPKALTNKIGIDGLRIYVSGQNLYTITKYTGFDPEVGTNGIDNNVYPVTKVYSLGVNLDI